MRKPCLIDRRPLFARSGKGLVPPVLHHLRARKHAAQGHSDGATPTFVQWPAIYWP